MLNIISNSIDLEYDNSSKLYYGDPGDSRSGYLFPVFPDYWFAPGARPNLQVPGVTGGRGNI